MKMANVSLEKRLIDVAALVLTLACCAVLSAEAGGAMTPLQVAYAGSMGSMMDGGVRPAIAKDLNADLQGRAQGSTGLAKLIEAGNIRPDVFISVTPGPMRTVIAANKAASAIPIARTEMVIAYSSRSQFAADLAKSGRTGAKSWWQILEDRNVRFGRTDPTTDPQGLNIIFTMRLAADYYHQPDLADKILGTQLNPQQIYMEPQVMARLQAGQLDASSAYKTQPDSFGLPFITLPKEINLGDAAMEGEYKKASVTLNGKTFHPSPLVFYAAVMKDALQAELAARFVTWLQGDAARAIFAKYHYDEPGDARPLAP
jgi:molybdate/tungstate transport system substrate-binding protein